MVRGPGIMVNETVQDVNVNIDIAPTIVEMSGGTVNEHQFDGRSFLPFIKEGNIFEKGKLFSQLTRMNKMKGKLYNICIYDLLSNNYISF